MSKLDELAQKWLDAADSADRAAMNPDLFESQRINLNAAADALRSCAWDLQEALQRASDHE